MSSLDSITLNNFELARFLLAIVFLLFIAHLVGYLFHKFKLPKVIGEIIGGLLAGPTVFGFFLPEIHNSLFNAFEYEGKLISMVYWLGLILLMFVSGFETKKFFIKKNKNIIIYILLGATIFPFIAGWIITLIFDFSPYLGIKNNMLALQIIVSIAVAVTSIPVISRIFIDLNIIKTRFARIILGTATFQDIILWIGLAIATGLVNTQILPLSNIFSVVIITILFFLISLLLMPKIIGLLNHSKYNFFIKNSVSGYALFICLLFTVIASLLNVNIVFGAFLAGIVIGLMPEELFEKEKKWIKEISLGLFVPLYFAIVGLKLDLIHHFDVVFFLGFLLFSTTVETIGTFIAAKLAKKDRLTSFNLAIAMNTRGGPGIVLATVAFEIGIINESFFVTLVIVAIITSLIAGYWLKYVLSKGWHLYKD